ncbi:Phytosulfokine receptor 1 [Glycine soja]
MQKEKSLSLVRLRKILGRIPENSWLEMSNSTKFESLPTPSLSGPDSILSSRFFCCDIKCLNLSHNFFSGSLPDNLFHLRNNSLGGSFTCSAMKNLTTITVIHNQFHCSVLGSLTNCLRLEGISTVGRYPVNFKNLHNTGGFKPLQQLKYASPSKQLPYINQEMPQPQGQNLEFRNLKIFALAKESSNWKHSLYYLNLSNNSFTGNIRQSLTMFLSLQHRNLSLEVQGTSFLFPFYSNGNSIFMHKKVSSYRPSLLLG